jgi:50S ribosomal protein L16 3-hydroxylase
VSRQRDLSLVENAPLKILKHFRPEGESVLSPGDLLYLPPEYAHEGVALEACQTYSIGFRAPSQRELQSQFLIFLEDRLAGDARYRDPDLSATLQPARIDARLSRRIEHLLDNLRWTKGDVDEFIGCYLTEPKPQIVFSPPRAALSPAAFMRAARHAGVKLALPTLMLYDRRRVFINGEASAASGVAAAPLRALADARRLPGRCINPGSPATEALYRWYRAGYICLSA